MASSRRRRLKNTPAARLRRQATAYARLAAKASKAGDIRAYGRYVDLQIEYGRRASRIEERETERQAAIEASPYKFKDRI